ncbi:MAG: efflux RND transporter periplasmic adaptor subunit [Alphaproteobacteria bacterium]|nr:efflux RND transporter periplasmic adaptor subunit [Alphaproteobacteria bacterium]
MLAALFMLQSLPLHAAARQHARPEAATDTVIVAARALRTRFTAFGEVEPVALTSIRAVEAGVVEQLVLPGDNVAAGQVLAVLGGTQAQSLLAERQSAFHAAEIRLAADRRRQAARLVTRQAVAADEAAYQRARGQLKIARDTLTLRAPAAGEVVAVRVSDGERIFAGQRLLSLQTGPLWLKAIYYGQEASAIRPGMTGNFIPMSGPPIPVQVKTVARSLAADGGEQVILLPRVTHSKCAELLRSWRSGTWGDVELDGPVRTVVAVPTRALILDHARWWVLVHTPAGDRRQAVVPGPARGWMTIILQGLEPGMKVVAQNAYLAFHQDISQRYAPAD